ncbi:MAG: dihydropteroate synthase [candidate division Zixibacteria bacterium SM23_73_2]|nr:MAG: dihydropteroate synthase [candidate division Zixibacteria bacterium SM23_73_2]
MLKTENQIIEIKNQKLDFSQRTYLMGVLNVTPDSFYDGGKFFDKKEAIKQGIKMAEEGADIIDIGGESTRPGSESISVEDELSRVIPVMEGLVKEVDVPLSIDTYKSEVAKKALEAGASMVNDISALRFDPRMKNVIKDYEVPVVLMHIKGTPKDMQKNPHYDNLMGEITGYLSEAINVAEESGIDENKIIIDPGIGFGKRLEDNLEIIKKLSDLKSLGKPILVGVSRKSFIGKILELQENERLEGSLAALAVAIVNGANIIRVHDVKESKRVARIVDSIKKGC